MKKKNRRETWPAPLGVDGVHVQIQTSGLYLSSWPELPVCLCTEKEKTVTLRTLPSLWVDRSSPTALTGGFPSRNA